MQSRGRVPLASCASRKSGGGGESHRHSPACAAPGPVGQAGAGGVTTPPVITRPIRHIGIPYAPGARRVTITYRADMEADTRARLARAGFEFDDEDEKETL